MKIALLTAGKDPHYALGLAPSLAQQGVELEVVGSSEMEGFPGLKQAGIQFYNLRGDQEEDAPMRQKVWRVLRYYQRLVRFASSTRAPVFHILWDNKFVYFDRTLLNLYYRILGKKLVFTAHNINTEARDRRDSLLNRVSLKIRYRLMDHVFVHTGQMKAQLQSEFGLNGGRVSVVRFPVNDVTPSSSLSPAEARERLGLKEPQKTLLFFGNIAAYKGLIDLVEALPRIRKALGDIRLLLVGNVKKGEQAYFDLVRQRIEELDVAQCVLLVSRYVPEEEVELYFKAAHLAVLPYRNIYQSGVLFLAYRFGLPVIVTDVGSLREDVIEDKTGFVCRSQDPEHLADTIIRYFQSELFLNLPDRRSWISEYAAETYSWEKLAKKTREVYGGLVASSK